MRRVIGFSFASLILLTGSGTFRAQAPPRQPDCNCGGRVVQPYTAEFKVTQVQTLANGTTITRESTEIEALDSAGQRLRSSTEPTGPNRELRTMARVSAPGGGIQASWQSWNKTARIVILPPRDQRHGCWASQDGNVRMSWFDAPRPGRPAPNGTVLANGSTLVPRVRNKPEEEDLGTSNIQGVEVTGLRLTTAFPAGQFGNDAPIVTTNESWRSQTLGLALREITDDPRTGKRTRELVNITLSEPDPALFQPPAGYQVTTEELHPITCPPQP